MIKKNRETLLKGLKQNNITDRIKGLLDAYEVMFLYFGGSIAYGIYDEIHSDIDLVVFVKGYDGFTHSDIDGYDLFIYGKDYIEKRFNCDEEMPEYYVIFIDDKLGLPDTLIYLNPKYEKEYIDFINYDLRNSLKNYLKAFYNYFMYLYVDLEVPSKRFYHVIRIKGQLENYLNTGVFDLTISSDIRKEMLLYKNHYNDMIGQKIYINAIPKYLEFIKEMEERL